MTDALIGFVPRKLGFQEHVAIEELEFTFWQPVTTFPFTKNFTLPSDESVTRMVFVWRKIATFNPDVSAIEVIIGILMYEIITIPLPPVPPLPAQP
jgi:hypothetical protein